MPAVTVGLRLVIGRKLTDKVVILNASLRAGDVGVSAPDWPNARATKAAALLQAAGGAEDTSARDTTTSTYLLFLMPNAPITARSRVRHPSLSADADVVGQPRRIFRRGRLDHYEVDLQVASDLGSGS